MAWIAPTGAALVAAAFLLYVVYSQSVIVRPGLAERLTPLLGGPRRILLISGVFLALIGVVLSPEGLPLLAGLAAALGMRHAVRRQWAFGLKIALTRAWETELADDVVLAVLPDGRAAPVAWLEHVRVARAGDVLLVACGLARSLAAFEAPSSPVLVLRPIAVGFAIGAGRQWDGVTGAALGEHAPLQGLDVDRITAAAWREAHPDGVLLGPTVGALRTTLVERVVRIPGANAAGVMEVVAVGEPRRWLARWAAERSS